MIPTIVSQADALPVALFQTDIDGRLTGANDAYRALVQPSGALALGSAPWSVAPPGDRAAAERIWHHRAGSGDVVSVEFRIWRPDGTITWIRIDCRPTSGGFDGVATDITEQVSDRQTRQRLETLFDAVDEAVVVLDREGRPLLVNDAARLLIGAAADVADTDLVREPTAQSLIESIRHQVPRDVVAPGARATRWRGEVAYRSPDGFNRTLVVQLVVERADDGAVESYAAALRDVTAERQLHAELTHQATHDSLTGLPNRTLFLRTLAEAIDRARTTRAMLGVLFVDLDNLKDVNDSIGHEYGDALLSSIAHRLASATRPSDVVARIGGDEFVILCEGIGDSRTAHTVAERIRQSVSGRMVLQGIDISTSASIGVALATVDLMESATSSDLAVTLMRNADTAMYHAKLHGRSRVEMFTDEMRVAARDRLDLAADLERAAARDELQNVYMPIVSAHDGRIVAAEALLRWHHPVRGLLTPPSFIEVAIDRGLIVTLGDGALRRACADLRRWIDQGSVDPGFTMHVNVSARELVDHSVVERIMSAVRDAGLSPSQLALEITEHALAADDAVMTRTLHALRRQGIRLALDDFGRGSASITQLQSAPIDEVKLDEAVVRRLGQASTSDDAVVRSVIQLAHSLDMTVIAEWVTNDQQLERLRALGCDLLQGHRVHEAVSAADFVTLLARRSGSLI
jgi:diguanylate cyclase (GGDEF)-like protein/PAS domain S-box-containing protein